MRGEELKHPQLGGRELLGVVGARRRYDVELFPADRERRMCGGLLRERAQSASGSPCEVWTPSGEVKLSQARVPGWRFSRLT